MLEIGPHKLRVPEGDDGPPDVPLWLNRLATDLADVAKDGQGTLAARPVSTALQPSNIPGRYWYVTGDPDPEQNGRLWRDTGSAWVAVATPPPDSVTEEALSDALATVLGVSKTGDLRRGFAQVLTTQLLGASPGPSDLATAGPSVSVEVGASGLVAVRASVRLIVGATGLTGRVYLQEDARTEFRILQGGNAGARLVTVPGSASGVGINVDPNSNGFSASGDVTYGGWLVFETTPGAHTYKLRYGAQGTSSQQEGFADRKLWVKAEGF